MKAKLQFNLPEEQAEFDAALNGIKWKQVAEEMRMFLRGRIKNEDYDQGTHKASEKLYTIVDEAGLNFD